MHTVLLIGVNHGFGKTSSISKLLGLQGNTLSASIIWMVVSGLLFSWLGNKLFNKGQKPPKGPPFKTFLREAGGLALAAIAAAAGVSLVAGIVVNGWANAALAVSFGGIMISQGGQVVSLLVSSAWSSTYGLSQSARTMQFSAATGRVAMLGSIAAFLLCALPFMNAVVKGVLGVLLLVAAFVLTRRQGQSVKALFITLLPTLFILGITVLLSNSHQVFAHDGSWQEAGGTFSGWIHGQGAVTAMTMGIGPGIGTFSVRLSARH